MTRHTRPQTIGRWRHVQRRSRQEVYNIPGPLHWRFLPKVVQKCALMPKAENSRGTGVLVLCGTGRDTICLSERGARRCPPQVFGMNRRPSMIETRLHKDPVVVFPIARVAVRPQVPRQRRKEKSITNNILSGESMSVFCMFLQGSFFCTPPLYGIKQLIRYYSICPDVGIVFFHCPPGILQKKDFRSNPPTL